jgi:3'-phosphoadenosine 5'-phosphosulfate (PAPS) 3'-phosphatase
LYFAEAGKGAFGQQADSPPVRLHVSDVQEARQAKLFTRNAHAGDIRPVDELIDRLPFGERIAEGSIGTKVSRVASGEGECFVHTNNKACKWDTLGAEIIIREAGGILTDLDGNALNYAQPSIRWSNSFAATNNPELHAQVLAGLRDYASKLD